MCVCASWCLPLHLAVPCLALLYLAVPQTQGCASDRLIDTAVMGGPKVFVVATLASVRPASPFAFRNYELPDEATPIAEQLAACAGSCKHHVWEVGAAGTNVTIAHPCRAAVMSCRTCSWLVAQHNTSAQWYIVLSSMGVCCAQYQQKQHRVCESSCQKASLEAEVHSYADVSRCRQTTQSLLHFVPL